MRDQRLERELERKSETRALPKIRPKTELEKSFALAKREASAGLSCLGIFL